MKSNIPSIPLMTLIGICLFVRASAQCHGSASWSDSCSNVGLAIYCDSLSTYETSFGDGMKDTSFSGLHQHVIYKTHVYAYPGTYTVKHVKLTGASRIDSSTCFVIHNICSCISGFLYDDKNTNCIKDVGDNIAWGTTLLEIDSNGYPIDTIDAWFQYFYPVYNDGISYTFKVIGNSLGYIPSCPSSGTSTVTSSLGNVVHNDIGFNCSASSSFDIAIHTGWRVPFLNRFQIDGNISSNDCDPKSGTYTVTVDPKYTITEVSTPSTISGNVVTFSYSNLDIERSLGFYIRGLPVSGSTLKLKDTVLTTISCPVLTGDTNVGNNFFVFIDTIKYSWDPNEKIVSPAGNVAGGTNLTYTISFENTGNAPAENIHIMDTLSPNVDEKSLQIVSSSHQPNVMLFKQGGYNILKFDFPGIHLLDSSHHGQCDGFVIYSVKAKNPLPVGTKIDNRAGIYFDANPVVMTNVAENIIAPLTVINLAKDANVLIYPNPAKNELKLKTAKSFEHATITNVLGEVLIQETLPMGDNTIDVHTLSPGMYYLILQNDTEVKALKFEKL